jgi:hypothetical protein
MSELAQHYTNEQTGISYTLVGDYYLPDFALEIEVAADDEPEYVIGKYGHMRETYLKKHRRVLYSNLLMSGELAKHLRLTRGRGNGSRALSPISPKWMARTRS